MRLFARSAAIAVLAFITTVVLAVATTMTSVALAATALIMGGTGHPLSRPQDTQPYIQNYVTGANGYIAPSGLCSGGSAGCTLLAVYTPEQFRFDTGLFDMTYDKSVAVGKTNLDECIRGSNQCTVTPPTTVPPYNVTGDQQLTDSVYVVYGYSQSAVVATLEKRDLIANPEPGKTVRFVLDANPNRPNGGILERFKGLYIPILGVTFSGATPTNSDPLNPMTTVDIVRQYDGWADFPTNPLNLLADLNAAMGIAFLHSNYYGVGTPEQQGQYGDTTYYMISTPILPLLMPLDKIPVIGHPLADTLDPFFRVLVEAGYNRTINPGQPTPAKWGYIPNPISTLVNLVVAIPTGLDNLISDITGNPASRPFGTTRPGPYGVGGPPVDTGCGTPPCGSPTPALAAPPSSLSTFAASEFAAKRAPQPSASDPTPTNGAGDDRRHASDGEYSKRPDATRRRSEHATEPEAEQAADHQIRRFLGPAATEETRAARRSQAGRAEAPPAQRPGLVARGPVWQAKAGWGH